jgi:hypothetical protein
VQHTGKIYFSGEKMRMDGIGSGRGSMDEMSIIIRQDLKKHFMLNAASKRYFEKPLDENDMQVAMPPFIKSRSEKVLGTETVSGYPCTKKEIEADIEIMGMKRKARTAV